MVPEGVKVGADTVRTVEIKQNYIKDIGSGAIEIAVRWRGAGLRTKSWADTKNFSIMSQVQLQHSAR